jgi:putative nucleotidyltransferase with HDIG domain
MATVPILRHDKVVAAIGIGNKPQPYDGQDIDILSQLANLAWNLIEVKKAETALEHANRALMTLSMVNRELVHATDEAVLMRSICKTIVEQRGYRMAWVGYARDNADKDIELMASAGVPKKLLDVIRPGWGDDARAIGPTGRAIRTGKTQIARDIANEPPHDWKDAMLKAGCASDIALPLKGETGAAFGLLHVYAEEVDAFTDNEIKLLEEMAGDLAFGVNVLRIRLQRDDALRLNEQHLAQMRQNLDETVVAISKAVEARDPYTAGHQRRVAELAVAIGREMGLDADTLQGIHLGATIHDIGKINIPAEILSKPFRLNEMEYLMVKEHPKVGYEILKDIHFPWPVAEVAYQHHERIDGSGYPQGLKGEQICLEARIVAVADVVEAMGSHRPYRPGLGSEAALTEISDNRGRFYDSDAVDACLKVMAAGFSFS